MAGQRNTLCWRLAFRSSNSMSNPTLRQIATACGVSVSTVSRDFNGHPSIPAATRRKIERKARSMGWRPNPLASAYMAHLRSTQQPRHQANLAFLISFNDRHRFADLPGYHKHVFEGSRERALALGYSLEPVWLHSVDFKMDRLDTMLRTRGILGLVVHGGNLGPAVFEGFDWSNYALATWGFGMTEPHMHRAAHNLADGMQMMLPRLRAYGYRRVALVISQYLDQLQDHASLAYYLYGQHMAGEPARVMTYACKQPGKVARIEAWLREHRPDAVIGDDDVRVAMERLPAKLARGMAFISVNWDEGMPEYGGLDHRPRLIGSNVLDLLAGQIIRNERGIPASPKLLLNEGRWVDGPSVPDLANGR